MVQLYVCGSIVLKSLCCVQKHSSGNDNQTIIIACTRMLQNIVNDICVRNYHDTLMIILRNSSHMLMHVQRKLVAMAFVLHKRPLSMQQSIYTQLTGATVYTCTYIHKLEVYLYYSKKMKATFALLITLYIAMVNGQDCIPSNGAITYFTKYLSLIHSQVHQKIQL